MKMRLFVVVATLLIVAGLPVMAAEYFVGKQGNDANNGRSPQSAFLTVQKGVNALQAGDTLTIAPGEYFESVTRDGLGNLERETTIRAELPGTVVLRGDVPLAATAFRKLEGTRCIYVADFEGDVQGVNEVDTLTRMPASPTVQELEFAHGSSYYDAERKRLYISPSDMQPPQVHHYTVSVIRGSGLLLTAPRRVTVDGIAATGFQSSVLLPYTPGHHTVWGILLNGAKQCIIRNSIAWFNGGGIGYDSDRQGKDGQENGWNLFEKCIAYANGSKFGTEGGNIIGFQANHDEMRDCYSYLGADSGLRFYGAGIRGPAVMKNNISWGSSYADIFIKGGEQVKYGLAQNCIALGIFHVNNVKNSIIGSINQYNREPGQDTIYGLYNPWGDQRKAEANRDQWFADALNLDFRLQATSTLRGTGPNGSDRGVYPYVPNIFYISQNGNDNDDGLSMKNAWKTLAHAMSRLRPGDTLYLDGGVYDVGGELKVAGDEGQLASIRGRGNALVILLGNLNVSNSRGVEFERLNFSGAVTVAGSRDIVFNNCRFSGAGTSIQATATQNLKVTHGEFTGFTRAAIALEKSSHAWLSGNLFNNDQAPAVQVDAEKMILYSDYNSYNTLENVWRIAGVMTDFNELQKRHDRYSRVQPVQYIVRNGLPLLQNATAFGAGGPHGGRIGLHRTYRQRGMSVSSPRLHSVSDTTANFEWWTSVPAVTTIAWGETPDTPHKMTLNDDAKDVSDGFNSLSLTGLKPGAKYYFRLLETRPIEQSTAVYIEATKPDGRPLSFTTATAPAATRLLYVAPSGDDGNSGLSRQQAWKTVSHAADMARAGDTVLIAGGVYTESVRVRASGSPGRPITFTAIPGEKATFDGKNRDFIVAFAAQGKEYIHLDGLNFRHFGNDGWRSVIDLRHSRHLRITRCFFNAYGVGNPGVQMRGDRCDDVLIRNCVIARGFQGMYFEGMTNLRIENNVFMNNLICPILNSGGGPNDIQVRNNIFVDSIPYKAAVHLFELGGFEQYVFENNAFYLRMPDAERKPLFFYGGGKSPYRLSIAEYGERTGQANLVVDDPQFAMTRGQEPVDSAGKKIEFWGDWIPRAELNFPDLFTENQELTNRNIGLLPEEFKNEQKIKRQ